MYLKKLKLKLKNVWHSLFQIRQVKTGKKQEGRLPKQGKRYKKFSFIYIFNHKI